MNFWPLQTDVALTQQLTLMQCCPKMDLVAIVYQDNSLAIHRLSWAKQWFVAEHPAQITTLAWRTDGKALAVGYANGTVSIFDVENGEVVSTMAVHEGSVAAMIWTQEIDEKNSTRKGYEDRTHRFLPPLSWFKKSDASSSSLKQLPGTMVAMDSAGLPLLDILITGDSNGTVALSVMGTFLIGKIDVARGQRISELCISGDLGYLAVTSKESIATTCSSPLLTTTATATTTTTASASSVWLVAMPVLQSRRAELLQVAGQGVQMRSLLDIIKSAVDSCVKVWDDTQQLWKAKMDCLQRNLIAHGHSQMSVEANLLMALAEGRINDALMQFVGNDLKEQGIRKLEKSLEAAAATIRQQLCTNAIVAADTLLFRAGELLGCARWEERFGILGVEEEKVENLVRITSLLLKKLWETLDVLQDVKKNTISCCKWLASVHTKSLEDQTQRISMPLQTVGDVAAFLRLDLNNDRVSSVLNSKEKDGNCVSNVFAALLHAASCVIEHPAQSIAASFHPHAPLSLPIASPLLYSLPHDLDADENACFVVGGERDRDDTSKLTLIKVVVGSQGESIAVLKSICQREDAQGHQIEILKPYNSTSIATLSLSKDSHHHILSLIDTSQIIFSSAESVKTQSLPHRSRQLDGLVSVFAVSSNRQVACVELMDPQRITLFDLANDEEGDDNDNDDNNNEDPMSE